MNNLIPKDYFGDFLTSQLSQQTIKAYRNAIIRFFNYQNPSIDQIAAVTRANIDQYRASMQDSGYSRATINQHLSAISAFFSYLYNEGMIPIDPTVNIKRFRQDFLPKTNDLSADEIRKVFKEIDKNPNETMKARDRAIIIIGVKAGLRRSEIASLTSASFIKITAAGIEHTVIRLINTKSGETQDIPCTPDIVAAVNTYAALLYQLTGEIPADSPIFRSLSPTGGSYLKPLSDQSINKLLKAYARRAGIDKKISAHSLRHSCATLAIEGGAPLIIVQEHLRHADPRTTERYIHRKDRLQNHAGNYIQI